MATKRELSSVEQSQAAKPSIVVLSNGIKLIVKQIPPSVFIDVMGDMQSERPKPPVVMIKSLGRKEENLNDKDYLEALADFKYRQSKRAIDVILIKGVTVKSVPSGIPKHTDRDQDWYEDACIMGQVHTGTNREAWLLWLKSVALQNEEDMDKLMKAAGQSSGVPEEDVEAAMDSFRSENGRDPDTEDTDEE